MLASVLFFEEPTLVKVSVDITQTVKCVIMISFPNLSISVATVGHSRLVSLSP